MDLNESCKLCNLFILYIYIVALTGAPITCVPFPMLCTNEVMKELCRTFNILFFLVFFFSVLSPSEEI